MFTKEDDKIFLDAFMKYGAENQKHVAIEELSELQKEICKDLRNMTDRDHISEEMADVEIMLHQLKMIYKNQGKVETYIRHKIVRLNERLKEDNIHDGN